MSRREAQIAALVRRRAVAGNGVISWVAVHAANRLLTGTFAPSVVPVKCQNAAREARLSVITPVGHVPLRWSRMCCRLTAAGIHTFPRRGSARWTFRPHSGLLRAILYSNSPRPLLRNFWTSCSIDFVLIGLEDEASCAGARARLTSEGFRRSL